MSDLTKSEQLEPRLKLRYSWYSRKCNSSCHKGFLHSSVGKESACNAGDPGSIPESGISAGEGIGCLLQYSWASLVTHLVKNPPAM